MNPQKRREIFTRFKAANPKPTTELQYSSDFQLLIAVLLSAQTTDKSVNIATAKFFPKYGTPQKCLRWGKPSLPSTSKRSAYTKTKAKNAIATCKILLEQHGGVVPQDRAALEALPGVGRKTANVVLNTAFGQPTIAVDTHIFRVANRTKIAPGTDVVAVEKGLEKFIPEEFKLDAHHWLILHGRYICVARTPKCTQCGISDLCEFRTKTQK